MFQFIKSLLPRPVSQKLATWIRQVLQKHWAALDQQIPKYELPERHFVHLKALANRESLLARMPKNGVVAELGVDKGDFSAKILELTTPVISKTATSTGFTSTPIIPMRRPRQNLKNTARQ